MGIKPRIATPIVEMRWRRCDIKDREDMYTNYVEKNRTTAEEAERIMREYPAEKRYCHNK